MISSIILLSITLTASLAAGGYLIHDGIENKSITEVVIGVFIIILDILLMTTL